MADDDQARETTGSATGRPTREHAASWIGARLDELSGAGVGKIEGIYVAIDSGLPEWILIRVGRFGHNTLVPAREAVAGAGHVWIPWERKAIRRAPQVEPGGALNADEERQLCEHYGIPASAARAADLAGRKGDEPTVEPLGGDS